MQVVTPDEKVCDSCRGAYYDWKKNNPEFSGILSRIEKESLVDMKSDAYENSVNEKDFSKIIIFSLSSSIQ